MIHPNLTGRRRARAINHAHGPRTVTSSLFRLHESEEGPNWRGIDRLLDDSPDGLAPEVPFTEISYDSDTEIASAWNKPPWSSTSSERGGIDFQAIKD
jgi:hypothetical protein